MSQSLQLSLSVIDQWMKYQLAQGDWPGAQLSVRQGGRLVFNKAYGFADLRKKRRLTPSHAFRIASQSKVFTTAVTLRFESKGLLSLKDPIVKYLPELAAHADRRIKHVTIFDLLTNRAGLIRDSYRENYWSPKRSFPSTEKVISEVLKTPLIFSSGKKTKYSNIGYALLGAIIERVGRDSFENIIKKELLSHFNLKSAAPDFKSRRSNLAQGYLRTQKKPGEYESVTHKPAKGFSAAAGFCANTTDTTRFFHNLYQSEQVLDKKQRNKILKEKFPVSGVGADQYGLGTIFSQINNCLYIGHSGGFPGFSSQTWVVPKLNMTIGFSTNVSMPGTFSYIQSTLEIIKLIPAVFSSSEKKKVLISKPIIDNFGSTIYVIGQRNVIAFPLGREISSKNAVIFIKIKNKFYSNTVSAYRAMGEPLSFIIRGTKIKAVKFGGFIAFPIN